MRNSDAPLVLLIVGFMVLAFLDVLDKSGLASTLPALVDYVNNHRVGCAGVLLASLALACTIATTNEN